MTRARPSTSSRSIPPLRSFARGKLRAAFCIAIGTLYDTGHAVFRPKHMTPEELEHGYAWIYLRLFAHTSIWRRRLEQWQAVPLYLAMSYLYKRSNRFWHLLIKHDLVNPAWKPLVQLTRIRHLRYRWTLEQGSIRAASAQIVSAGV